MPAAAHVVVSCPGAAVTRGCLLHVHLRVQIFTHRIKKGVWDLKAIVASGGMPSSHSALVAVSEATSSAINCSSSSSSCSTDDPGPVHGSQLACISSGLAGMVLARDSAAVNISGASKLRP